MHLLEFKNAYTDWLKTLVVSRTLFGGLFFDVIAYSSALILSHEAARLLLMSFHYVGVNCGQ